MKPSLLLHGEEVFQQTASQIRCTGQETGEVIGLERTLSRPGEEDSRFHPPCATSRGQVRGQARRMDWEDIRWQGNISLRAVFCVNSKAASQSGSPVWISTVWDLAVIWMRAFSASHERATVCRANLKEWPGGRQRGQRPGDLSRGRGCEVEFHRQRGIGHGGGDRAACHIKKRGEAACGPGQHVDHL